MSTQTESEFSLNREYLKSKSGILRIAEAAIALGGLISETEGEWCTYTYSSTRLYYYVVLITLIISLCIIVILALQIDKRCTTINWQIAIFLQDVVCAILYLVSTILMMIAIGDCYYGKVARSFAGMFGVCGTVVVGSLAIFGYLAIKDNQTYEEL